MEIKQYKIDEISFKIFKDKLEQILLHEIKEDEFANEIAEIFEEFEKNIVEDGE